MQHNYQTGFVSAEMLHEHKKVLQGKGFAKGSPWPHVHHAGVTSVLGRWGGQVLFSQHELEKSYRGFPSFLFLFSFVFFTCCPCISQLLLLPRPRLRACDSAHLLKERRKPQWELLQGRGRSV